jgi:signal transduction histidine kinase
VSEHTAVGLVVVGLVLAGALATVALLIVTRRRRDTPGARTFGWFLGIELAYILATVGLLLSPGPRLATGFYYATAIGGTGVGVTWVLFVVEYAGYWDRMRWWTHLLVWGVPAVYGVGILTNPWHGAILGTEVTEYGFLTLVAPTFQPLAFAAIAYILLLVLGSYAVLLHLFLRTRNVHKKQTGAILAGALVPTIAYGLYMAELTPHPALDITPVAFVLEAIVVGWALFRYDFLAVSPIATELYLQRMADPLLVLDERDRLVDYNDAAAGVLGIDDAGNRPHLQAIDADLEGALGAEQGTVELSTPDGLATFDLTQTVIRDQHDRERGTMVVLRDVTELEAQRAELERKNAQLERFTSVVSHDLRNPLNVAKGFAELARDQDDPEALERSIAAMDDMERLIDDLLTLAREGQTVDDLELVSFLDVVHAAWDSAPTTGASLEVADGADFECYADPDRFEELLGNLFRNAVEHGMPEEDTAAAPDAVADSGADGGEAEQASEAPALTVTVAGLEDRNGFYVEDDGVGIPASEAVDVFDSGYSTAASGTGLGLAIVRSIASGHGWGVSLTASDAGGARFEFEGVRLASDR